MNVKIGKIETYGYCRSVPQYYMPCFQKQSFRILENECG